MTAWPAVARLLTCLTGAVLVFSRYLSLVCDDTNRFFLHWSVLDGVALALLLFAVGTAAFVIDAVLRRLNWKNLRRLFHYVLLFGGVSGTLAFITTTDGWGGPTGRFAPGGWAWLAVAFVVVLLYCLQADWILRSARAICLTLSPVVPLLLCHLLTWNSVATPAETMAFPHPGNPDAVPVFVVVFDEWSWQRSFDAGQFQPGLPHIRELAAHATTFTRAESEGFRTWLSIPRLLFQTARTPVVENGRLMFRTTFGDRLPSESLPSLFSGVRERGYNTAVIGFYMPYRTMLGDQADSCATHPFLVQLGSGLTGRMLTTAWRAAGYYPAPIGPAVKSRSEVYQLRYWHEVDSDIANRTGRLIAVSPRNIAAFIHWNAPHPPYLAMPSGADRGPESCYFAALRYADQRLGQLIQRLKSADKYDDALVIVTSDHSWRAEPDVRIKSKARWVYQVPLVVKWPSQRRPEIVRDPLSLIQIQPLIDGAISRRPFRESLRVALRRADVVEQEDDLDSRQPAD